MRQVPKHSATRRMLTLLGAVVPLAIAALAANPAVAAGTRVTLAGSRPGWASRAQRVGKASGSVDLQVYLAPRGGMKALQAEVAAVSTPGSSRYHHYITPAQYRARFGADAASVSAVSSWLAGAGLNVHGVDSGLRYIRVTGSVAAAEKAFGVTLSLYKNQGRVDRASDSDISVPSNLSGSVLGVMGLNSPAFMKPAITPLPGGFRNAHPCSLFYRQLAAKYQVDGVTRLPKFNGKVRPYAPCGYVPNQFRGAYGVDSTGLTGAGVTVAITDAFASPTILYDANTYATVHGDPAFGTGQFAQSYPPEHFRYAEACGATGWYGEETLDVEAVHAMALDANVTFYASRSCGDADFLEALQRVVDDNTASIVTNSWGEPSEFVSTNTINAYEQIFMQGALQGIGFFFSSGDSGDDVISTGLKQTDYPTSDPNVTAVGGTSTGIGIDNSLVSQTGWGTWKYTLSEDGTTWNPIADPPFLYGSGGGFSSLFARPTYQDGVVPPGPSGRGVPDVSLDGDPNTGMLVGETQVFPDGTYWDEFRIGGTSLSSPLMAGMQADAEQNAGERLGFANPAIYALALSDPGAYTDVLHVTEAQVRNDFINGVDDSDGYIYSVRTWDQDSSLKTQEGWDDVTGIGSPNDGYLTAFGS